MATPINSIEELVMRLACNGGARRGYMPRTFDQLLDRGLIDDNGEATEAGRIAYRTHQDHRHEDALRRNVVADLRAEEVVALGKLSDGQQLTHADAQALRPHDGSLVARTREGFKITALGRQAYGLAAGRTY